MKSHASMNRIYRLVFNAALGIWVAVAENARGKGKGKGKGGRAAYALIAVLAIISPSAYAANAADATRVGGAGTVTTVGNTTTINQASHRLALDWTQLSTAANEALIFNQPNAQAIALNRITGSSPSTFLGSLTANGQVFILNPNGILFGAGSQVNVGGIVASTLGMNPTDFMNGSNTFTKTTGTGSVVNKGSMTAASGGYLALLAPEVRNEGVMTASLGTALLAAGNKVTLNLDNGSLLGYSIDQGAINALAENKQLIKADGGQVLLSAKALDALTTATVNNTGVIEARTIQNKAGRILLMGDMEHGTVNVGGTLDASAPNGGDGGFIETSAAHVKVATGTRVTTHAAAGQTGKWLIDPNDFTIAASGGDMDSATVVGNLATTNFEIQTATMGTAGNGDIHVNEALSWSSANTLTLTAQRDININQAITATNGGLTLNAVNQITAPAAVNVGTFTLAGGSWSQLGGTLPAFSATDFRITGGSFLRALGGDGRNGNPYLLSDVYGLQGIGAGGLTSNHKLANNIDASGTANWNAGAGFKPIGDQFNAYNGTFDGNNKIISNLTINRPGESYVGLFGRTDRGVVQNVGLTNVSVKGLVFVGGLVGHAAGGIVNSYVAGSVAGLSVVGGLAGLSGGGIGYSYTTGSVTGEDWVGGLVGWISWDINRSYSASTVTGGAGGTAGGLVGYTESYAGNSIVYSYATGNVSGGLVVGGLVGWQYRTGIRQSYATGSVRGSGLGTESVGALVGLAELGRVASSFWLAGASPGIGSDFANGVDSLSRGLSNAEFKSTATYTNAAWNISNVGGDGLAWRIYEGQTGPLLRNFLTGLTLADSAATYSGDTQQGTTTTDPRVQGTGASGRNAGSYASGYYSDQQGVDIIGGSLTVNRANLVLTSSDVSKTYDGGTTAAGTAVATASTTLLGGDTATGGSFAFADKNVGTANKTVTANGVTVNDGNGGNNYNVSYADNNSSTINKADLTVTASTVTKTYDGTNAATGAGTAAALAGAAAGELVDSPGTQAFLDKNAGVANKNVRASGVTIKDASNADVTGNYNIAYIDNTISTINKASLTLAAATDSKTYDGTVASSGVVGNSGLVGGDTVTAAQSFGSKNVMGSNGSTLAVAGYTLNDGNSGGNYNVTTTTAAGTINKATLNITATPDDKVYDGTTLATASYTDNRVAGDVLTYTAPASFASKNVGNGIAVTVGGITTSGTDAGNYTVGSTTVVGNTADITPKTLTVTANDDSKMTGTPYSGGNGVVYSGLVAGDNLATVVAGAPSYSGTSQGASAVGSYAITPGGLTAASANYTLGFASGVLRIAPAPVVPKVVTPVSAAASALGEFATLRLGFNPVDGYSSAQNSFQTGFKNDIATALNIDVTRINIQSLNSAANDE